MWSADVASGLDGGDMPGAGHEGTGREDRPGWGWDRLHPNEPQDDT